MESDFLKDILERVKKVGEIVTNLKIQLSMQDYQLIICLVNCIYKI